MITAAHARECHVSEGKNLNCGFVRLSDLDAECSESLRAAILLILTWLCIYIVLAENGTFVRPPDLTVDRDGSPLQSPLYQEPSAHRISGIVEMAAIV